MSEFGDSSFHNNSGRRTMTPEEEEFYPWEQLKSSDVDICREFLKLCIVEDPIWDKISRKLEEPLRNIHVDYCPLKKVVVLLYQLYKLLSQGDCFIPFDIKQSFSRLVNLLEVKQHVSTSVKEIDNVQLGIVNQAELKLLPKAFFSLCTAA
ncbi:hypothetical protein Tco_1488534 [Tanacetum coccineum]